MTCFDILLAFPVSHLERQNIGNRQRLDHLRKHSCADEIHAYNKNGFTFLRYAVCDKDAIGLLRDLPFPVFCVWIKLLRTDTFFYSYFKATGTYVIPPRSPKLLKDVYWAASKLEKGHFQTGVLQKAIES
jgi:hypothetical protein